MTIRYLDPTLINQIAAGEVIERPASAIKELVENAIDAGATHIEVLVRDGGRTHISVTDNGQGMDCEDLNLAVERHATSKIPDNDLFNIRTLGFRGEALASIGAVSRLTITSRQPDEENGWQIFVEGGRKDTLKPIAASTGTRVEIRDLFYAIPARLKFLKSATTEINYIRDILHKLALVNPQVHLSFRDGDKLIFQHPIGEDRLNAILGRDFSQNSSSVKAEREGLAIHGAISVPTHHTSTTTHQYFFVNGRPVKDKILAMAVRVAYQDYLVSNRFPYLSLFLQINPEDVDINVHPAKSEVRFRDSQLVKNFMISAIKEALKNTADKTSTTLAQSAVAAFSPGYITDISSQTSRSQDKDSRFSFEKNANQSIGKNWSEAKNSRISFYNETTPSYLRPGYATEVKIATGIEETPSLYHNTPPISFSPQTTMIDEPVPPLSFAGSFHSPSLVAAPRLGYAKAQLAETYIVAETAKTLILVDQHAAHERLLYEQLKIALQADGLARQVLLIPEIIALSKTEQEIIAFHKDWLIKLGFVAELVGESLMVREAPALLKDTDFSQFIKDLAAELTEYQQALSLPEALCEVLASHACRHSIRAGRKLSLEEMNALLRQMEETPFSGQCNHGRPTYIELHKQDIEKLFGRT